MLGEVLVASFFLQLLALASPLFFQVVIDKVLVHRSLSTLDVLVLGLVGIAVFETIWAHCGPMCLPTPPIGSTSNSARGYSVICWRCRLLTFRPAGSAIPWHGFANSRTYEFPNQLRTNLIIDLFFTLVFLGVMFAYSPLLTFIVMGSFPFYIAISVAATPLFRRRLNEKFKRGAENQAFLVESVNGIETLKVDGGRAADAAAMGGAARRLTYCKLPRAAVSAIPPASAFSSSTKWSWQGCSITAPSWSSRRADGRRTGGFQYVWPDGSARRSCGLPKFGRISIRPDYRWRGWEISSIRRPEPIYNSSADRVAVDPGRRGISITSPFAIASMDPKSSTTSAFGCRPGRSSVLSVPLGRARAHVAKLIQRLLCPRERPGR